MSNKIDSLSPEAAAARTAATVPATSSAGGKNKDNGTSAVAPTDSVELTSTALSLQKIDKDLRASPSFDAQKVEKIRSAIQAGTYKTDPVKVANGLVTLERLLGGK